jgi:hypothetical protein
MRLRRGEPEHLTFALAKQLDDEFSGASRPARRRRQGAQSPPSSPAVHGSPQALVQERGFGLTHCDMLGAALPSSHYEIRVIGILPPEALLDFEHLDASIEPVETVLHGPLQDQAALQGLLARLQTLGVQVVEVRRLHSPLPPDPALPDGRDQPID